MLQRRSTLLNSRRPRCSTVNPDCQTGHAYSITGRMIALQYSSKSSNVTDERFSNFKKCKRVPALAQTTLTWFSQLKLSVIITPSSLNDVTRSTAPVLSTIGDGGFLEMRPNNISLVFFVLIFMKLWWDHVATWSAANCIWLIWDWSIISVFTCFCSF